MFRGAEGAVAPEARPMLSRSVLSAVFPIFRQAGPDGGISGSVSRPMGRAECRNRLRLWLLPVGLWRVRQGALSALPKRAKGVCPRSGAAERQAA